MSSIEKRASELLASGWWPDETVFISVEFGLSLDEARQLTDEMARQKGGTDKALWGIGK